MKICIAQTRPVAGDMGQNVEQHRQLIDVAVSKGADLIIFPELSLTGYEPELANDLAVTLDDSRLDPFQQWSDAGPITIGVGMPIRTEAGVVIGSLIFQPNRPRQLYSKQYLHPDEEPFFCNGTPPTFQIRANIALAICYELSVPAHAEEAFTNGASIYIASVAKSAAGVEKATERLAEIAKQYRMLVCMANSVGLSDTFIAAGQSSIWNREGLLIGQLSATDVGILGIDADTQKTFQEIL